MTTWKAQRFCYRAVLRHEGGLLEIVKYKNSPDCWRLKIKATFHCYYRRSINDKFGWNVNESNPVYKSLDEAKKAGELWLKNKVKNKYEL